MFFPSLFVLLELLKSSHFFGSRNKGKNLVALSLFRPPGVIRWLVNKCSLAHINFITQRHRKARMGGGAKKIKNIYFSSSGAVQADNDHDHVSTIWHDIRSPVQRQHIVLKLSYTRLLLLTQPTDAATHTTLLKRFHFIQGISQCFSFDFQIWFASFVLYLRFCTLKEETWLYQRLFKKKKNTLGIFDVHFPLTTDFTNFIPVNHISSVQHIPYSYIYMLFLFFVCFFFCEYFQGKNCCKNFPALARIFFHRMLHKRT